MIQDIYAQYDVYEKYHLESDAPTYVTLNTIDGRGLNAKFIESETKPTGDEVITSGSLLSSGIPKMLISADTAFYHSILDQISSIIFFHKRYGSEMVVVLFRTEGRAIDSFIIQAMQYMGVRHLVLDNRDTSTIEVKNFFYTKSFHPSDVGIKTACLAYESFLKEPEAEPTKKVYLSRRKAQDTGQYRIDDEVALEDYFRSNGFEIVYPEDFTSMVSQINFMNKVAVLASVAGSGLMNQLFMQNYQSVLSLDSGMGSQFSRFSEIKYAYLVTVDFDKVVATLIEKLENNKEAQKLIKS